LAQNQSRGKAPIYVTDRQLGVTVVYCLQILDKKLAKVLSEFTEHCRRTVKVSTMQYGTPAAMLILQLHACPDDHSGETGGRNAQCPGSRVIAVGELGIRNYARSRFYGFLS
jgi:hypothetical protein